MSAQKERDEFIARATQIGLSLDTARKLLRYATTLQRLAEAQCNGDWPADNGERKVQPCPKCEAGFVPSSFRGVTETIVPEHQRQPAEQHTIKICPDCYASYRVWAILDGTGYQPYFQGDPRGAVLQLFPAGTSHDDMYCGHVRGIYVPPGR